MALSQFDTLEAATVKRVSAAVAATAAMACTYEPRPCLVNQPDGDKLKMTDSFIVVYSFIHIYSYLFIFIHIYSFIFFFIHSLRKIESFQLLCAFVSPLKCMNLLKREGRPLHRLLLLRFGARQTQPSCLA